jgi:hypothetical protein
LTILPENINRNEKPAWIGGITAEALRTLRRIDMEIHQSYLRTSKINRLLKKVRNVFESLMLRQTQQNGKSSMISKLPVP